MTPLYVPNFLPDLACETFLTDLPWEVRTDTRSECFLAPGPPYPYTYGKGRWARTYYSVPMPTIVTSVMATVNQWLAHHHPSWGPMTGCFANRYDHDRQHLGWHADDFAGMDHTRCVAVVSFGEARELWWRPKGTKGEVPLANRQLLGHGSLLLMPPGMQHEDEHRIPKGSCVMGARVSLTLRAFW